MSQIQKRGLKRNRWWALVRNRRALPVLFASKQQALDNQDPDEYLVRVEVRAVPKKA